MPSPNSDTSCDNQLAPSRPLRKRRTNTNTEPIDHKRLHLDETNGHDHDDGDEQPLNLIERTNALPLRILYERFLPPADELTFEINNHLFEVELTTAGIIHDDEFKACFKMLEQNMKEGYQHSELGWHPNKKKREMRHPAMRYLLLFDRSLTHDEGEKKEKNKNKNKNTKQKREKHQENNENTIIVEVEISSTNQDEPDANSRQMEEEPISQTINDVEDDSDTEDDKEWEDTSTSSSSSSSSTSSSSSSSILSKSSSSKVSIPPSTTASLTLSNIINQLVGFLSFMITDEEGAEVIYTYELDIHPSYQKLGLGKRLMVIMEAFGENVDVEKSMLTCFDSNMGARRFYEKIGYQLDEISPGPKLLRNGVLKESTYHILSKSYHRDVT